MSEARTMWRWTTFHILFHAKEQLLFQQRNKADWPAKGSWCRRHCLPEPPQGSTLLTLLLVSPQGSAGGATTVAAVGGGGGAPPPHGSVLVGEVGDATPHGSAAGAGATPVVVPHGPDTSGMAAGIVGGGEGPAEPALAATVGAPQGSAALSSIRALCRWGRRAGSHKWVAGHYQFICWQVAFVCSGLM